MLNKNSLATVPNRVTRTLICVNGQENMDYSGVIYNPFFPQPVTFRQLIDIFYVMESFFDDICFPAAYYTARSFSDQKTEDVRARLTPKRFCENDVFDRYTGSLATFELEVHYRQKATWQGAMHWKEGGRSHTFNSALDLIKLMDNVIQGGILKTG